MSVTKVARNLSKYDGGSDLDLLREILDRTPEQEEFLSAAQDDDWRRPLLQVEDVTTTSSSIFAQPVNALALAQTPTYRLRNVLVEGACPEEDARAWQLAFVQEFLVKPAIIFILPLLSMIDFWGSLLLSFKRLADMTEKVS